MQSRPVAVRRLAVGLVALLSAVTACADATQASGANVTPADTAAQNPFSGDDSWIAYQTDRAGESIWLVHPDGSDDHQLQTGLSVDVVLPDWSPDGMRLAFATRGGPTEPLYEYDLETQQTRQLFSCEAECLGDDEPAYSPDGETIAFVRAFGPFVNDAPSDCGLWLGDRRTGEALRLTTNTDPPCDREYFPRWSPDGQFLTYHRELTTEDGSLTTAVHVLRSDGQEEKQLTSPDMVAGAPDWSPDGQWIVFGTYPLNAFQDSGDSQLYRIHPDGTGLEQLTDLGDVRATQPRYTPDGEWIIFTAVTPTSRHLWALPATGGTPFVLVDEERIYTHPTWQP